MLQSLKTLLFSVMAIGAATASAATYVTSPDGRITVTVDVSAQGVPLYSVDFDGIPYILPSALGINAKETTLGTNVTMQPGEIVTFDETWTPVWGEYDKVRNHYNELPVTFTEKDSGQKFIVRFRVMNDGLGFRYEIPIQDKLSYLTLLDEATQFNMSGDPTLFAIPGDYDTDEFLYTTAPMSQIGNKLERPRHTESTLIPGIAVQTPLTMVEEVTNNKTRDRKRIYSTLHEANLQGYPMMSLQVDTTTNTFKAHLTPDLLGIAGYLKAPFNTPWRAIIISDDPREILASQLIYNLNEPCAIEDTSWIKPQKFMGVWWEMFTGNQKSWAYSTDTNLEPGISDYTKAEPNHRHPANNDNVKRYIDFAAEAGIPGVLVEGWNQGWEDWGSYKKNRQFRFDLPYPDFDPDMLQAYAKSKGVKLIMHHETSANAADYERQLDTAFKYMQDHGYDAVKTGYVGYVIPRSERHSTQWMVDHYLNVVKKAADYKIMVDSHEAVRPTGLARTWPNWVAQESARGGEYEAMGGNNPEHTTILPFTRLKGGPMDYTPGLFRNDLSVYGEGKTNRGSTTLTKQLALYLTLPSPLQMACDVPESYQTYPDAFQFIKDVPVDWSNSVYIEAEPGDYITVARKDKHSDDWYIGTITDEQGRTAIVPLDFLTPGVKYEATIYEDAPGSAWNTTPQAYRIRTQKVDAKKTLKLTVAPGGGTAIRLQPLTK